MELVTNIGDNKVFDVLKERVLNGAESIDIAVSYLKTTGYIMLRDLLREKTVRLLVCTDMWITDGEAIKRVLEDKHSIKLYQRSKGTDEIGFHPKIYIAKTSEEVRILIGSSNISTGGFGKNVEANLLLVGRENELAIESIQKYFNELWMRDSSRTPDIEFLEKYSRGNRLYRQQLRKLIKEYVEVDTNWEPPKEGLERDNGRIPIPEPPEPTTSPDRDELELNEIYPAIIMTMSEDHDVNKTYDQIIGCPISNKNKAEMYVDTGTLVFIRYTGNGVKVVVRASEPSYIDYNIVPVWIKDANGEKYPVRVKTESVRRFVIPIKLNEIIDLGLVYPTTNNPLSLGTFNNTIIPLSEKDALKLLQELIKINGER